MANLPPTDNQAWWVVVNDAIAVTDIARGLKRQNINFSKVRWIGCRPSIGIALKKCCLTRNLLKSLSYAPT